MAERKTVKKQIMRVPTGSITITGRNLQISTSKKKTANIRLGSIRKRRMVEQ